MAMETCHSITETAKLRYFRGVNQGSSEAVAYIDEEEIIALVVLSSKTEKGLMDALLLLLGSWRPTSTALELWAPIDMIRSVP